MKERKPIRSEMGWSTIDKIVVRGHDLPNQLIGKIDLGSMAFLEIMGRRPTAQEADTFNALLVTLVEHGMTPQAIATRMISAAAPEALQAAVAAGLCGVGSVFAGGSEQCAKVLQEALKDSPGADDLVKIAADIVESYVRARWSFRASAIPCTSPSIRARRCCSALRNATAFAADMSHCWKRSARKPNGGCSARCRSTPPAPSVRCCANLDSWRICRGIAVISRAVGLVGHIAEEMRNPIALEIWERTEAEVYENKN